MVADGDSRLETVSENPVLPFLQKLQKSKGIKNEVRMCPVLGVPGLLKGQWLPEKRSVPSALAS